MIENCQQILANDKNHNLLDAEIITFEKTFKETLDQNQLKLYLQLESMVCNQINYDEQLIYNTLKK